MRIHTLILLTALLTVACTEPIQINEIESQVLSVENGNTIILTNGLTVKLIGIRDTPDAQNYLENYVKGKNVALTVNEEDEQTIDTYDTDVYAYVDMDGDGINGEILRKWGGKLDYNCLIDSLEVFKSYLKRVKKEYTFEELFTKYAQATFLLYDGGGIGTGFFINSDGLAISNAHVLNHRSDLSTVKVYVWDSKGEVAEHRIWTVDKILKERYVGEIGKDDWVIFQIRKTESEKFIYYNIGDISKDPIRQGQEIAVLGNPKGKNGNFTNGTVNNIEGNLVTISADINLGNSGGPVINKFGEVIGIATWINNQVVSAVYENDFSKHNYAFNIQPVREVLNEIGVFYGGK